MNLFYDFGGVRHEITRDEIDAIERSAPPHLVQDYQDYAAGRNGRSYYDVTAEMLSCTKRLMRERPGQTEPGTMPVQKRNGSTEREMFERTGLKPMHWLIAHRYGRGTMSACQGSWEHPTKRRGGDGLSSASFRNAAHSARACPRCVELFNEHNR